MLKPAAKKKSESARLLLVDDSEVFITALSEYLKNAGYRTWAALGGENGLKMAQKHTFDAILLDVSMPDINGFEVLRRLKLSWQTAKIPVIMLSASCEDEYVQNAKDLGAAHYLNKATSIETLLGTLKALL